MKLKPCPFCGGEAKFQAPDDGPHAGGVFIECSQCRASSTLMYPEKCDAKPLLAERWNTRTPSTSLSTCMPRPDGLPSKQKWRCNICGGLVQLDGTAPKKGTWP